MTSLDGAAIRDILKVLGRRYANAHVVIRPTRVQGEGAALDIARGLAAIARVGGVDVVIVGRGGGSIEDLWAFNEEVVARAIAGCPVPTISAVGHETDVTIADFVADVRAPTPSAAAEIVVARHDDFRRADRSPHPPRRRGDGDAAASSRIAAAHARGAFRARRHARPSGDARPTHRRTDARARSRDARAASSRRERRYQRLRLTLETFDLRRRLAGVRTRLVSGEGKLTSAMDRRRHRFKSQLGAVAAKLESLSPLAVLARGYAVCWNGDRTAVIRDASSVAVGDSVTVTVAARRAVVRGHRPKTETEDQTP